MKRQQILIGFLLLTVLFLLAGCRNNDDQPPAEGATTGDAAATVPAVLVSEAQPISPEAVVSEDVIVEGGDVTAVEPTAPAPVDQSSGEMGETVSSTIVTQHTVQDREWLNQIARCYGTSPQDVVTANNLPHPGWIMAGEVWQIPNVGSVANPIGPPCIIYYTVKAGDTLLSISRTYSVPLDVLVFTNYGCAGYNAHYDMTYRPIPVPHPVPHVDGQVYYADYYYGYGYLGGCTYHSYPTIYPGNLLVIPVNYENMLLR